MLHACKYTVSVFCFLQDATFALYSLHKTHKYGLKQGASKLKSALGRNQLAQGSGRHSWMQVLVCACALWWIQIESTWIFVLLYCSLLVQLVPGVFLLGFSPASALSSAGIRMKRNSFASTEYKP